MAGAGRRIVFLALLAVLIVVIAVIVVRRQNAFPSQGSPQYEQISRAFYRGLASLEVGLLDDARREFGRATEVVPQEPAGWANLGIAQLRLGELDAASEPVLKALSLAPGNGDLELLAGRMEIARGRLDEGVVHLRRAIAASPNAIRPRFALAEQLEQLGAPESDDEAQRLLDDIARLAPTNLAAILERARVAAKRGDAERLRDAVNRLQGASGAWPPVAQEQYAALRTAVDASRFPDAARTTQLLRNVLARVPAYGESLAAIRTPAELIANPFDRFIALDQPNSAPSPADMTTSFVAAPFTAANAPARVAMAFADAMSEPVLLAADAGNVERLGTNQRWPMPVSSAAGILPLDWNHDFRTDLVLAGPAGLRLLLRGEDGSFADATARAGGQPVYACECLGAWAADLEMDGDLDIVAGRSGATVVLRNNGDGTWRELQTFAAVTGARGFAWADLDRDGDPDAAFLDGTGAIRVFVNRQAGEFVAVPNVDLGEVRALAAGDLDADGRVDLVAVDARGRLARASLQRSDDASASWSWRVDVVASSAITGDAALGVPRVLLADFDNNGALDVAVSANGVTRVWLMSERLQLQALERTIAADAFSALDLNGDGRVDLAGVAAGRPLQLNGQGQAGYHWKTLRVRAQQNAGDQRINAFGVGGEIEVRSGLLVQKQVLTGGPVHVGLGTRTAIDVARILWPNGVAQAEFDPSVDDSVVAEQRLKGSCPWVFAGGANGMEFVTDFLWRSPLGLRINAQDTAGTTQTEDWIRIRGDQLVARDGVYDVRITAELWETHFFDHVALMVVDHPAGTEVFVDERFSAAHPPSLMPQVVASSRPVAAARDERGRDVTELVARNDGRYLTSFEKGAYQGIARDHFVEIDLPAGVATAPGAVLVARGWVYPTDSSINVAIAQGAQDKPRGLTLEAQDADGRWRVVEPDLGFPAGKNKTMLIDLAKVGTAPRVRLRSNLEIYWDSFAFSARVDAALRTERLAAASADLRYRGFSATTSPRGDAPETPRYARIVNRGQRWRDLAGYYTRYGDVRELLAGVDDRYVIMNAGDEMRLAFRAPAPPATGWRRDFVLIGDGWEKDGDFNTGYSATVLPLPTHARSAYVAATASDELEDDPVYRAHRADWETYHTRYVSPDRFLAGLRAR